MGENETIAQCGLSLSTLAQDRLRGLDDDELRPWEVQQVETIEANARVWNLLQEARERKSYSTSQSVQEWVKVRNR